MLWIVIPAYNEGKKIKVVLKQLLKAGYKNIVVVDDGSTDDTYLQAKDVTVLRHVINRGQGAALQTGIEYAQENGAKYIVTFDSDGQHDHNDIPLLLEHLKKGNYDIALGNRFEKSKVPFFRKVVIKGGVIVVRLMYGIKLGDVHNGFRIFSHKVLDKLKITQDRMEHASEILENIAKHKLKYVEVPVNIVYTDYSLSKGQSSLNAIKIFFKMLFKKLMG